jgi:hypothetical protein
LEIIKQFGWIFYLGDEYKQFNEDKSGKWMYFFGDRKFVEKICEDAVKMNIVKESKHTDGEEGVACFYLDCDDIDAHKKVILYFLENGLIKRTKSGRLYNISFKLDNQTRAGEYGDEFKSEIKLSKYVDLNTGEWLL